MRYMVVFELGHDIYHQPYRHVRCWTLYQHVRSRLRFLLGAHCLVSRWTGSMAFGIATSHGLRMVNGLAEAVLTSISVILLLRTFALWGNNVKILFFLIPLFVVSAFHLFIPPCELIFRQFMYRHSQSLLFFFAQSSVCQNFEFKTNYPWHFC